MAEELIDIVDENNELTGEQQPKSEAHRLGLWHRAAHVWIYNDNLEILLQLRSKGKDLFPNTWDVAVAGHISAGEQPINTAVREMAEEIGLKIKADQLLFFKIKKIQNVLKNIKNNEFIYIYFLLSNVNIADLKLQKKEVQDIKLFPLDKLKQEIIKTPEKFLTGDNYWTQVFDRLQNKKIF